MNTKRTGQMTNCGGIPLFIPNDTVSLKDQGCYVSYNNHDITTYGCDTTALVRMDGIQPTKFLILNGNHVAAYLALETYQACVDYFKQHADQQNKRSENWDEEIRTRDDGTIYVHKLTPSKG